MCDRGQVVGGSHADLNSVAVICCSAGHWNASHITAAVAIAGEGPFYWPIELFDEAAITLATQSYLRCKKAKLPAAERLKPAWDFFHRRYRHLVRRVIAASGRRVAPASERDDLSQEVWREIVVQLPRLKRAHVRGGLDFWLAGLARRKVLRLAHRRSLRGPKRLLALEGFEASLASHGLGPEDACRLRETWDRLDAALAQLRERTSSKNYDLFRRRFLWRESAKEIAAALGLTQNEVRCRYHRVKRKWRLLTRHLVLPGCGGARAIRSDFTTSGNNFGNSERLPKN